MNHKLHSKLVTACYKYRNKEGELEREKDR